VKLHISENLALQENLAVLIKSPLDVSRYIKTEKAEEYAIKKLEGADKVFIEQYPSTIFFIKIKDSLEPYKLKEYLRKAGKEICVALNKDKASTLQITSADDNPELLLALAEGILLSNYQFLKYKTSPVKNSLHKLFFLSDKIKPHEVNELNNLCEATLLARDLVNEPVSYLTAEQLSEEIKKTGNDSGFSVDILSKVKIEELKMGGLLAVNKGSVNPPTFNILEYKSPVAKNSFPIILIGKGVVYDTGGLSLKPTESMALMKCDMAGAAVVIGALTAAAKNKLPLHLIGLIPATDNMPGENAITPGDVITMYSGKTVEVLNTDAEGRLILADALSYANQYNPELVVDFATLTGAALRAIGPEGIVVMGTASETVKQKFKQSGNEVYERLVEFPLWEEYEEQLKSDIADLKNIGGSNAGAITAGKFLEKFVDYEWLHFDIAGSAFLSATDSYRGKNGTGAGVRLVYDFLKRY